MLLSATLVVLFQICYNVDEVMILLQKNSTQNTCENLNTENVQNWFPVSLLAFISQGAEFI